MINLKHLLVLFISKRPHSTGYEAMKFLDGKTHHSHQQIYRTLSQLAVNGVLTSKVIPNTGKPDAKAYSLCDVPLAERYLDEVQKFISNVQFTDVGKGQFNLYCTLCDIKQDHNMAQLYQQYMRLSEQKFLNMSSSNIQGEISRMLAELDPE